VIAAATRYERASDVDHALELLGEPDAKAIAGGQSLIPVMKLRIARPSVVVDISRLDLCGVEERDGALHIGPLTTWAQIAAMDPPAGLDAITECASRTEFRRDDFRARDPPSPWASRPHSPALRTASPPSFLAAPFDTR